MTGDERVTILDVTDESTFERIPPCADPGFDHRSCDYWEDADRGSKAARLSWLQPPRPAPRVRRRRRPPPTRSSPTSAERPANPFAPLGAATGRNPFLVDDGEDLDNPFAPRRAEAPAIADSAPRKLQLLGRGLRVAGSYAKVLLDDDAPAVYCQFGPLSAYPRAQRTRDLYPALPDAPLPAVITCIATTAARPASRSRPAPGQRGLRRPRRARLRRGRDLPGARGADPMRPARRRPRSGRRSGSSAPSTTSGSRSCAASSRDPRP